MSERERKLDRGHKIEKNKRDELIANIVFFEKKIQSEKRFPNPNRERIEGFERKKAGYEMELARLEWRPYANSAQPQAPIYYAQPQAPSEYIIDPKYKSLSINFDNCYLDNHWKKIILKFFSASTKSFDEHNWIDPRRMDDTILRPNTSQLIELQFPTWPSSFKTRTLVLDHQWDYVIVHFKFQWGFDENDLDSIMISLSQDNMRKWRPVILKWPGKEELSFTFRFSPI